MLIHFFLLLYLSDGQHGGSTNAFTASEHTNYYFDITTDSFEEALDRYMFLIHFSKLIYLFHKFVGLCVFFL